MVDVDELNDNLSYKCQKWAHLKLPSFLSDFQRHPMYEEKLSLAINNTNLVYSLTYKVINDTASFKIEDTEYRMKLVYWNPVTIFPSAIMSTYTLKKLKEDKIYINDIDHICNPDLINLVYFGIYIIFK